MKGDHFVIPVYPHVKKYMETMTNVNSVIDIEKGTLLGHLFIGLLQNEELTAEHNDQYRNRLTKNITVKFCPDLERLNPQLYKLIRINIVIDSLMKSALLSWIASMKCAGIPPYTACQLFLDHYNIDEDQWGLDAAYKFYQRAVKFKRMPKM